ncbi:probable NAD(P)H dehydrogenase subunit CRR3, chloroplastic isoform X1 [Pistacia vera]|uniref:probable NAD(P)H dehydrogenase subunit CRR3, chloroplastic isoform X1 n=1 Tax=Pistacia vera TaxID=55513 RepID=UPI00126326BF|nr:probable NAD(P)H dehydrogenase subunit CRR3, chloroplastic isoform X1 [Pistacia vera]
MYCLSCSHYTTLASLTNNSSSTSPQTNHPTNPPSRKPKIPRKNNSQQQKQLQLMEIERAIGAGTFRDNEPRDLEKQKKIVFNGILPDLSGVFEGPVEKQLRETGEWFSSHTEKRLRSSRKGILMLLIKWILPIWTLSLLLALAATKLA